MNSLSINRQAGQTYWSKTKPYQFGSVQLRHSVRAFTSQQDVPLVKCSACDVVLY